MTPTAYPLLAAFTDDFADGVIGSRWIAGGSGTAVEAGGVVTLTQPGNPGDCYEQLALVAFTRTAGMFRTTLTAIAGAPDSVAGIMLANFDGSVRLFWGLRIVGPGYALELIDESGVVLYTAAHPGAPVTLMARRESLTRITFGTYSGGVYTVVTTVTGWLGGAAMYRLFVGTTAAAAGSGAFDDVAFSDDEVQIDGLNSRWLGLHLAAVVRAYGAGFATGASATLDGVACTVTVVSATELKIVGPVQSTEGPRTLRVRPFAGAFELVISDLTVSGVGYKILRGLLPEGRYTRDPTNPLNVFIAACGRQLDQLDAAAEALKNYEIHPATAEALLARWERILGLPTDPRESLAVRRARAEIKRRLEPRISVAYLNRIIDAVLSGVTLTENDHVVYGAFGWLCQVYEPSVNYLPDATQAALEQTLNAAGPGWVQTRVGYAGFVVSASRVGRDFV
jgi:uncharacterized protein YmfQ (DUF2313 family)